MVFRRDAGCLAGSLVKGGRGGCFDAIEQAGVDEMADARVGEMMRRGARCTGTGRRSSARKRRSQRAGGVGASLRRRGRGVV